MAITVASIIESALVLARGGLSPEESRIYEDMADVAYPEALRRTMLEAIESPDTRELLTQTVNLTITNGVADIGADIAAGLLVDALPFASCYVDNDGQGSRLPAVYKANAADMAYYLNPSFTYFTVKAGKLYFLTGTDASTGVGLDNSGNSLTTTGTLKVCFSPPPSSDLPDSFGRLKEHIIRNLVSLLTIDSKVLRMQAPTTPSA